PCDQEHHTSCLTERAQRKADSVRRRLRCTLDRRRAARGVQCRVAGKERRRVPVGAHAQEHEVEGRQASHDAIVELRGLLCAQLRRHPVHAAGVHTVKQLLLRHPVVAFRVEGWYTALVTEENGHPPPPERPLRKQLVGALRGRAAGQDQGQWRRFDRIRYRVGAGAGHRLSVSEHAAVHLSDSSRTDAPASALSNTGSRRLIMSTYSSRSGSSILGSISRWRTVSVPSSIVTWAWVPPLRSRAMDRANGPSSVWPASCTPISSPSAWCWLGTERSVTWTLWP